MKKYLLLPIAFFFIPSISFAQSQCKAGEMADEAFRNGNYQRALDLYNAAAKCPEVARSEKLKRENKENARKCVNRMNAKTRTEGKPSQNTEEKTHVNAKPQVDLPYFGQLGTDCNNGRRGSELSVAVKVENMKGKNIRVCCLIGPQDGDGKVLPGSDPSGEFTVQDGMSGQEQMFHVTNEEELFFMTFFVPFSVMNFNNNYLAQIIKTEITIFQEGSKTALYNQSQLYGNVETHTVAVAEHTDTYTINTDYHRRPILEWDQFAVCPGNEIVFSQMPEWITKDEEGLHVMENIDFVPRSANIDVASSEGGNVVKITVVQEGRSEGEKASAVINNVWMDEKIYDPRDQIGRLGIHVDCDITGALGKVIRVYALFYTPDGERPLVSQSGKVSVFNKSTIQYADAHYDDFPIDIYYGRITNTLNNSERKASFYICISEDEGKSCLARSGPYTIKW